MARTHATLKAACAVAGQLGLPVGVTVNTSYGKLARFAEWKNASGAIIHAWHSQSWAMHMFKVAGHRAGVVAPGAGVDYDVSGYATDQVSNSLSLSFSSGGQQGGRNWCRCDQCTYAGKCRISFGWMCLFFSALFDVQICAIRLCGSSSP